MKGTDYLASEARRIGLRPGGENGSYFQTVPMVERAADSASTLEVAGARLQLNQDYLPLPLYPSFLPYGSQLQADNPASFYAGRVGDSLTAEILAQSAGKLVVFGPALGEDGQPLSSLFAKGPPPAVPGAAGVAFATMDIAEKAALEFLQQPQAVVTTTVEDRRRIPLGMLITSAIAERLFGAPLAGLIPGTNGKPLGGQVKFRETQSAAPARNVVAILPGSDPRLKQEYVALGAHNDHIGVKPGAEAVDHDSVRIYHAIARPEGENKPPKELNTAQRADIGRQMDSLRRIRPPRADSIFNGADDDGSGSVTLLEIAEALPDGPRSRSGRCCSSGTRPKRRGCTAPSTSPTIRRFRAIRSSRPAQHGHGGPRRATTRGVAGPTHVRLVGSRRLSTELGRPDRKVNAAARHRVHVRLRATTPTVTRQRLLPERPLHVRPLRHPDRVLLRPASTSTITRSPTSRSTSTTRTWPGWPA